MRFAERTVRVVFAMTARKFVGRLARNLVDVVHDVQFGLLGAVARRVLQRAEPSNVHQSQWSWRAVGERGAIDPGGFGGNGLTPDVAAANPVIGSGGPRAIQLGLKLKF